MKIHFVCLSAIILLYCFLVKDSISRGPYTYDEADYMYAASLGFAANYTDSPTLAITDFARTGLSQGTKGSERMALSKSIRNSNDIVFYRHWHGPLFFYPLIIVNSFHLDEHTVRSVMLIIPIFTTLVVYFGSLWLLPGLSGAAAAWLSGTLFLWSYVTVSASELAPHQLFALCYMIALLLLAKMLVTGQRMYWFGAVVASALAFCVLEVAFVLILTLCACGFHQRRRLKADFPFMARSVLVFLVSVLIVWPGAILKLSFLKAFAFMAYLALYRKGAWGTTGLAESWWLRFSNSPVEWILIATALVLFFRNRNSTSSLSAAVYGFFGLLMILATLRVNSEAPRYALTFLPGLEVFAGLILAGVLTKVTFDSRGGAVPLNRARPPRPAVPSELQISQQLEQGRPGGRPAGEGARPTNILAGIRVPAIVAVCAALFFNTLLKVHRFPPEADASNLAILRCIRESHFEEKSVLVPQGYLPMLHYYFPKARLQGYLEDTPPIGASPDAHFDGVMFPGDPVRCAAAP
jgi:hypothetical protein